METLVRGSITASWPATAAPGSSSEASGGNLFTGEQDKRLSIKMKKNQRQKTKDKTKILIDKLHNILSGTSSIIVFYIIYEYRSELT